MANEVLLTFRNGQVQIRKSQQAVYLTEEQAKSLARLLMAKFGIKE